MINHFHTQNQQYGQLLQYQIKSRRGAPQVPQDAHRRTNDGDPMLHEEFIQDGHVFAIKELNLRAIPAPDQGQRRQQQPSDYNLRQLGINYQIPDTWQMKQDMPVTSRVWVPDI